MLKSRISSDNLVLGVDPGFAALGWALVRLFPDSEEVIEMGVLRTEKSTAKRHVLASDDNLRRAREITHALQPLIVRAKAICAESMSFPRNSGAAAKVAMTWGVLAAITSTTNTPLVQASPQEVKKALCGRKDASKEDIEEATKQRYGVRLEKLLNNVTPSMHNHAYDALAAVVACSDSEVLRLLRKL